MKNVRLMVLATIAVLFMGMANLNAQVKSVIISGYVYADRNYSISTINPSYEKTENKSSNKDEDFYIVLKQEVDKWLLLGYELIDSSIASTSDSVYTIVYFLTKKE